MKNLESGIRTTINNKNNLMVVVVVMVEKPSPKMPKKG